MAQNTGSQTTRPSARARTRPATHHNRIQGIRSLAARAWRLLRGCEPHAWPERDQPMKSSRPDPGGTLACAILRYLAEHPGAKTTAGGIARWWLKGEPGAPPLGGLERALSRLVSTGALVETRRTGVPPYYQLAPASGTNRRDRGRAIPSAGVTRRKRHGSIPVGAQACP